MRHGKSVKKRTEEGQAQHVVINAFENGLKMSQHFESRFWAEAAVLQCCTLHSGSLNVENRSAHKVRHRSNYVSQIHVWLSADSHHNMFSFFGSDRISSFYIVRKFVSKQTLKLSACNTVLPILPILAIFPILSIVSILPIFLRQ